MSTFERLGREQKTAALVTAIDRHCEAARLDPYADAAAVLDMLRRWSASQWTELAVSIGKRPPSEETRAWVCNVYRVRAEERAA